MTISWLTDLSPVLYTCNLLPSATLCYPVTLCFSYFPVVIKYPDSNKEWRSYLEWQFPWPQSYCIHSTQRGLFSIWQLRLTITLLNSFIGIFIFQDLKHLEGGYCEHKCVHGLTIRLLQMSNIDLETVEYERIPFSSKRAQQLFGTRQLLLPSQMTPVALALPFTRGIGNFCFFPMDDETLNGSN